MRTFRVHAASADRVVRHSSWGQGRVESSSCASEKWSSYQMDSKPSASASLATASILSKAFSFPRPTEVSTCRPKRIANAPSSALDLRAEARLMQQAAGVLGVDGVEIENEVVVFTLVVTDVEF